MRRNKTKNKREKITSDKISRFRLKERDIR